jgi:hypothetical protein
MSFAAKAASPVMGADGKERPEGIAHGETPWQENSSSRFLETEIHRLRVKKR